MDSFDIEKLKRECNLSDEAIEASGLSIDTLKEIYSDYSESRRQKLLELKNNFLGEYITPAQDLADSKIHSYSGRVKDPYHVVEKLVRKCSTNAAKYRGIDSGNYYKFLTDLIGCRILLVYKKDWKGVHQYLSGHFKNAGDCYIDEDNYLESYDRNTKHGYFAECPKAYIRPGDADSDDYKNLLIVDNGYYRSLHYIVRYWDYCVEIQVRTLFEEAWGEVDHDVLYPYYKDDGVLVNYSRLINRAAGMSDEMSSYFKRELLPTRKEKSNTMLDVPIETISPTKIVPQKHILPTAPNKIDDESPAEATSSADLLSGIIGYPKKDE